ncbi:MAG: alpha-L-arabinofuranosidase, partial [Ruminococcus sp.]|nr:alpha-L-arabinofuranosidase [Ruminococcus sp.]
MNLIRKITSAVTAAGVALSGAVILTPERTIEAEAAAAVSISPYDRYDINNGIFEGWGTSLCWWANRVGYSDTLAQKCADTFYGDDGLRLNIARFNIGGGDDPSHDHITRTDSNMPGYTRYNNGNVTYDWTADYNQRNVLQRSIKAAGDDMIVEMFSNSPPYYMTNSGCSTGNKDAGSNNLKDDCYDDFAEYMAEVCDHYQNVWGIDVQSVEPMNEPYTNFWGAYSAKQEGCHFDWGDSESRIITELRKALDRHGLQDAFIAGTDETSIDTQIDCYNKLSSDAKNVVKRIDTHTYGGSKRTELRSLALSSGKNLWMSEVDGSGTAGTNAGEMSAALWLAERIATDCNGLNSSAWILWQVIDNHISSVGYNGKKDKGMVNTSGGFWGLAVADHDKNDIILTKKYYAMGQYSRYIRPGMTMLKVSDNSMAAYDEKNGQLVIVAYNTSGSAS